MCGNALFETQKLKEDHVRQGQYFFEYLNFSCTRTCDRCLNEGWTRGVSVERSPVAALDVSVTSTEDQIDKFLPSVQIKKLINEGKLPFSEGRFLQGYVPSTTWTRLHVKATYSTLSSSMQSKRKEHSSAYFLDN